jgi:hypothetical protein
MEEYTSLISLFDLGLLFALQWIITQINWGLGVNWGLKVILSCLAAILRPCFDFPYLLYKSTKTEVGRNIFVGGENGQSANNARCDRITLVIPLGSEGCFPNDSSQSILISPDLSFQCIFTKKIARLKTWLIVSQILIR